MRTRYAINDAGELVSRDGHVLGRLTSITLETLPPTPPLPTGGEPTTTTTTPVVPTEVEQVWMTYALLLKVRRDRDAGDVATIRAALKVASVAECQLAIAGCSVSEWHMGRDPQTKGKSYKQLSQILKGKRGGRTTREQISFFIDIANAQGVTGEGAVAVDRAKLSRAKQSVMTAWEFPADERAYQAGLLARAWLFGNGIEVVETANGKPSFKVAA